MSSGSKSSGRTDAGVTVSFGAHFQASAQFDAVFKEGMALVERTATYLDGAGRREAKGLPAATTLVYATESMRLTTRLLEIASWLLLRRSVRDGEASEEEARHKRQRIKLRAIGRPTHVNGFTELPDQLRTLIAASIALNDRVIQLDRAIEDGAKLAATPEMPNAVAEHQARIEAAFGALRVIGGGRH